MNTHWYVVKVENESCEIVAVENEQAPDAEQRWGPFASRSEAIARRVGLIRAQKCQPQ